MEEFCVQKLFGNMRFVEQYAESVVSCSSRYNNKESISYGPDNIIGKPTFYPSYGDFSETYTLRSYGGYLKTLESIQKNYMPQDADEIESEDFIILKFELPVIATSIVIYETFNPGAVVRLWGGSGSGNWKLLWEGPPQRLEHNARLFTPKIRVHGDLIYLLRIDFNQSLCEYHTSIDGVLLAGYRNTTYIQTLLFVGAFVEKSEGNSTKMKDNVEAILPSDSDSFSILPYEIIVYIFKYLDLKSLCACARVNKMFNSASNDSSLYRSISFKRYWHKLDNRVLCCNFASKCKYLCKLDLSWCGFDKTISEKGFVKFLTGCSKTLTHLSLGNCEFVEFEAIRQISFCAELIELRLRNIHLQQPQMFCYLGNLHNLKALDLFYSNINDIALIQVLKNNPDLEHLNIDICSNLEMLNYVMEIISVMNKRLRVLSAWKNDSLSSQGVIALSSCKELRELDLGWNFMEPNDCLTHIAKNCKHLTSLVLSVWRPLTDHQLLPIIKHCTKLQNLDLLGIRSITADVIDYALRNLPDLKWLDIGFCKSISSAHIARWKSEFPTVTIGRSCEYLAEQAGGTSIIRPWFEHN